MVDTGHRDNTGNIVDGGEPLIQILKNIETVASMYPGRLVAKGTTDFDIKVADGVLAIPIGWLGYEQASPEYKPATIDTIYVVSDKTRILRGGSFSIRATIPKYFVARQGDKMLSWIGGQVVPGDVIEGYPAIALPFSKNASAKDTGVDLAQYMVIHDVRILVETAVGSGTIDVGIGLSESGYDADGFVDGEATSAAGLIAHILTNATDANNTLGILISTTVKSADGTPLYTRVPDDYTCDGTCVSIEYTTSNHTMAGRFFLLMANPGIMVVGIAEESVDASAAADTIWVRSTL